MDDNLLIDYIKGNIERAGEQRLRRVLLEKGYSKEKIDYAINAAVKERQGLKTQALFKEKKEKRKKEKGFNKKTAILIVSGIVVVFLALLVFFGFRSPQPPLLPETPEKGDMIDCGIEDLKSRCKFIEDVSFKDECFLSLAKEAGNSSFCNEIIGEDIKFKCLGIVNYSPEDCARIVDPSFKSKCYSLVAYQKENIELCNEIPDDESSTACMAFYYLDISLCEELAHEESRSKCYNEFIANYFSESSITTYYTVMRSIFNTPEAENLFYEKSRSLLDGLDLAKYYLLRRETLLAESAYLYALENNPHIHSKSEIYLGLANVELFKENYSLAEDYFNKAVEFAEKEEHYAKEHIEKMAHIGMSVVRHREASEYLRKAKTINVELGRGSSLDMDIGELLISESTREDARDISLETYRHFLYFYEISFS